MKISEPSGILVFAYHVNQMHPLIDGCAQEVDSHNLSVSPPYAPSLPKNFLNNMEIHFVVDGKFYCDGTKYLKLLAKDNFQLALVICQPHREQDLEHWSTFASQSFSTC